LQVNCEEPRVLLNLFSTTNQHYDSTYVISAYTSRSILQQSDEPAIPRLAPEKATYQSHVVWTKALASRTVPCFGDDVALLAVNGFF
jgi:hypothetical protein